AEKRADPGELVVSPVLEQASGLGADVPLARVRQRPPLVHVAAYLVDHRGRVVLLLRGGEAFTFIEDELRLLRLALLGLGDRGDEFGPAARFDDLLGWLAV